MEEREREVKGGCEVKREREREREGKSATYAHMHWYILPRVKLPLPCGFLMSQL